MEILVIRHVPFEDVGAIGPVLGARGFELRYQGIGTESGGKHFDGLILMGGPMSANDPQRWVDAELRLIRQAIHDGVPVLGICLGAQLIAKALGARVLPNRVKEIGWFPVHWERAAQADNLFRGLIEPEIIFHWHGETFDLPAGAVCLASSERCDQQAFRYGEDVYGLQFHLEVTPAMIADWVMQDANCGDMREIGEPIDAHANAPRLDELAKLVFGRWADLISQ